MTLAAERDAWQLNALGQLNRATAYSHEAEALAAERDAALAREAKLREALNAFLTWADQKCPCHNEEPNPCTLCGASVENLEPCKAADSTLPRMLLRDARTALQEPQP